MAQSLKKVAVVVGVGPGLGAAVARKFAKEGFAVALVARNAQKIENIKKDFDSAGFNTLIVPADSTDPKSVAGAFTTIREKLGKPEVLVYNAGSFQYNSILDITPESFEQNWKANCMGGFLTAKEVLADMSANKKGTILFTGATASLRGSANFANLAVGKFGLRALAQSIAREFGPKGVHVSHVIIDGQIDNERYRGTDRAEDTLLQPDQIAETYYHLYNQHPSAWTFELELRPHTEKW